MKNTNLPLSPVASERSFECGWPQKRVRFVLAKDKHGKSGKYLKNRGRLFSPQNTNMANFKKTRKGKILGLFQQNKGYISFKQTANIARLNKRKQHQRRELSKNMLGASFRLDEIQAGWYESSTCTEEDFEQNLLKFVSAKCKFGTAKKLGKNWNLGSWVLNQKTQDCTNNIQIGKKCQKKDGDGKLCHMPNDPELAGKKLHQNLPCRQKYPRKCTIGQTKKAKNDWQSWSKVSLQKYPEKCKIGQTKIGNNKYCEKSCTKLYLAGNNIPGNAKMGQIIWPNFTLQASSTVPPSCAWTFTRWLGRLLGNGRQGTGKSSRSICLKLINSEIWRHAFY